LLHALDVRRPRSCQIEFPQRVEPLPRTHPAPDVLDVNSPGSGRRGRPLGTIAFRQGRLEEATEVFLASLKIHPLPETHADLARVYKARCMDAEAQAHLEEAKRLASQKRR